VTSVGSMDARETRACAPIRCPKQRRVGLHHRTSLPSNEWLPSTAVQVAARRVPFTAPTLALPFACSAWTTPWRVLASVIAAPLKAFVARAAVTDGVTALAAIARQARAVAVCEVWYDRPRTAVIDSRAWSTSGPALQRNSPGAGESRCWARLDQLGWPTLKSLLCVVCRGVRALQSDAAATLLSRRARREM
jgi:hypothetical protein